MWWALVTATTVGYGDVSPNTETGRIIGAIVIIVGTGFVACSPQQAPNGSWPAELDREVDTAAEEIELSEADILAELRRLHDQLDRLFGWDADLSNTALRGDGPPLPSAQQCL